MKAIERDLIGWTKARLQLDAYVLDGKRFGSPEHTDLNRNESLARVKILRHGLRLLRKEPADAR